MERLRRSAASRRAPAPRPRPAPNYAGAAFFPANRRAAFSVLLPPLRRCVQAGSLCGGARSVRIAWASPVSCRAGHFSRGAARRGPDFGHHVPRAIVPGPSRPVSGRGFPTAVTAAHYQINSTDDRLCLGDAQFGFWIEFL
eukprot:353624-Chlamydomonas_euryale.AAC.3